MYRINRLNKIIKVSGFHTLAPCSAISRFNLPAMSPTMTEGTIHKWKKQEGETFSAGDVLLELETDKAQIDVEAPEDGVLAKIILKEGNKAPVNTLIALIAEEGDDLSNIEIPEEEKEAPAAKVEEKEQENKKAPEASKGPAVSPISHHDIDTKQLKKPLSPAVLSLVLKYGIKDVGSIKPSGYGGRILKGDVLAHLGLIAPKPAPQPNFTAAPPRDQIVFAKSLKEEKKEGEKKEDKIPKFISKQIAMDKVQMDVTEFIHMAAERAVKDIEKKELKGIIVKKKTKDEWKVFHLAEPRYDFIMDRYEPRAYTLKVDVMEGKGAKSSKDQEMIDLIGYLGGQEKVKEDKNRVQVKLDGTDAKANEFLDRIEFYVEHPDELVLP
ncbi:hypothetical protein G6F70_004130 [Rhizopus microsporus]|uniref:Pyridoxine biosynthesis protein n=2 Tax=Rhizopus TaxID=4842 RepID=A0A367KDC5_RHIAZ|nr:hypothetical protein G6F71_003078 [Rhizopus microsporus]RCI00243.1 hypothetical protein CU097_003532 [Rhizopus azygosporus]KAG1200347.1 hypothetical protein G6F70_004130 [Rhizopus microsporus]KAG1211970.1 hypothetical protein G6F69_004114 [Rhizopus microsporus]KAG1236449.1 hypothetical protein G6F67_001995 [Rhizopus microsporus]